MIPKTMTNGLRCLYVHHLFRGRLKLGCFAHIKLLLVLVFALHHHVSGMWRSLFVNLSNVDNDKQFMLPFFFIIVNFHRSIGDRFYFCPLKQQCL